MLEVTPMRDKINDFLSTDHEALRSDVAAFLRNRAERGTSVPTRWHYLRSLRDLADALDNPPTAEIGRDDLTAYVNALWLRYSPGTIRPVVGNLRTFFGWCARTGRIEANRADHLKKPRTKPRPKAADEDAILTVLRGLIALATGPCTRDLFGNVSPLPEDAPPKCIRAARDAFALAFLYETGCRAGELCKLPARALDALGEPGRIYRVIVRGKSGDREMWCTSRTAVLWRLWVTARPFDSPLAIYGYRRNHSQPTRLRTNGLAQMCVRRCDQFGVDRFRPHAIRHAKVKRVRQMFGLKIAGLLLDHSDIASTYEYSNIDDGELSRAANLTGLPDDLW